MVLTEDDKTKLDKVAKRRGRPAKKLKNGEKTTPESGITLTPSGNTPPHPPASPPGEKTAQVALSTAKKGKKQSSWDWRHTWYLFIGGGILVVAGLIFLAIGNGSRNPAVIALGAAGAMGGGFLLMQAWGKGHLGTIKNKIRNANKVIISASEIRFEREENEELLTGMPWRMKNDGRLYHVFFSGLDGNGSLNKFTLPDPDPAERYYDPAEALNCLRMQLCQKYFNYQVSTGQIVSLVVMGVVIGVEIIGLIAMGG